MSLLYFETDKELDQTSKYDLDKKLDELFQLGEPGTFLVVLHNDPTNGVDYVAGIIKKVFGYRTSKAVWLMLKAHFTGKSLLWSGSHKDATKKADQMISFGPDPNMLHKGAKPLRVTVEENG